MNKWRTITLLTIMQFKKKRDAIILSQFYQPDAGDDHLQIHFPEIHFTDLYRLNIKMAHTFTSFCMLVLL